MTELIQEKCRICDSPLHPFPLGEKNGYKLFACRHCGSAMAEPWVTPADRDKFFGDIQPDITHVPDPMGEIDDMKKIIRKIAPNAGSTTRFLDVNCRNGYAVVAAKQMDLQAKGIDAHDFFIRFAQSKYDPALFENVSAREYADRGDKADILFAREAFCEQTDPDALAETMARLLVPGGVLYIEEPDGNHFNVPGNFANWQVVFPPMNFLYPSKKGMTALLARHGLRVQKFFFSWRPVMRMAVVKT